MDLLVQSLRFFLIEKMVYYILEVLTFMMALSAMKMLYMFQKIFIKNILELN